MSTTTDQRARRYVQCQQNRPINGLLRKRSLKDADEHTASPELGKCQAIQRDAGMCWSDILRVDDRSARQAFRFARFCAWMAFPSLPVSSSALCRDRRRYVTLGTLLRHRELAVNGTKSPGPIRSTQYQQRANRARRLFAMGW